MYFRGVAAFLIVLTSAAALCAAADQAKVDSDIKAITTGKASAQMDAMDDVVELGPAAKTAVPTLIKELAASDPQLQWHAARAISAIGPGAKDAVPALTTALKSSDPKVRGYAANALESIGDASQPVAKELAGLLSDKDGDVRRAAMDALVGIHLKPEALIPIMKQALEEDNTDPSLVVPALTSLADAGDAGIAVLADELKNSKTQYWACIALAGRGTESQSRGA